MRKEGSLTEYTVWRDERLAEARRKHGDDPVAAVLGVLSRLLPAVEKIAREVHA